MTKIYLFRINRGLEMRQAQHTKYWNTASQASRNLLVTKLQPLREGGLFFTWSTSKYQPTSGNHLSLHKR